MKQHILGDLLSTIFPIAVKKAETVVVQLLHTSPKISFAHEHKACSEVSITTYNSKNMLKKQVSLHECFLTGYFIYKCTIQALFLAIESWVIFQDVSGDPHPGIVVWRTFSGPFS